MCGAPLARHITYLDTEVDRPLQCVQRLLVARETTQDRPELLQCLRFAGLIVQLPGKLQSCAVVLLCLAVGKHSPSLISREHREGQRSLRAVCLEEMPSDLGGPPPA